jgi:hypothetical protein
MKMLLPLILVVVSSVLVQAEDLDSNIRYIVGRGSDSRFCTESIMCPDMSRRRAQQVAFDDASLSCKIQQGVPDLYAGICQEYCQPAFIPSGESTWVSCRSECQIKCILPDPLTNEENQ